MGKSFSSFKLFIFRAFCARIYKTLIFSFVLYVNSSNTITDIVINDGFWHFVCVTWRTENGYYEIYLDGQIVTSGVDLNTGGEIEGNGILIIGQEQVWN